MTAVEVEISREPALLTAVAAPIVLSARPRTVVVVHFVGHTTALTTVGDHFSAIFP